MKIERIELREIRMPLLHAFETSFGRTSMRRWANSASIAPALHTSACTKSGAAPLSVRSRFSTSGELLLKLSTPSTSKPAACRASQVCEAM